MIISINKIFIINIIKKFSQIFYFFILLILTFYMNNGLNTLNEI